MTEFCYDKIYDEIILGKPWQLIHTSIKQVCICCITVPLNYKPGGGRN